MLQINYMKQYQKNYINANHFFHIKRKNTLIIKCVCVYFTLCESNANIRLKSKITYCNFNKDVYHIK